MQHAPAFLLFPLFPESQKAAGTPVLRRAWGFGACEGQGLHPGKGTLGVAMRCPAHPSGDSSLLFIAPSQVLLQSGTGPVGVLADAPVGCLLLYKRGGEKKIKKKKGSDIVAISLVCDKDLLQVESK